MNSIKMAHTAAKEPNTNLFAFRFIVYNRQMDVVTNFGRMANPNIEQIGLFGSVYINEGKPLGIYFELDEWESKIAQNIIYL